jgi:hypothetical protein
MVRSQIRNSKFEIRSHETTNHTNDPNKKTLDFLTFIRVIRGFLLAALIMAGSAQAAEADKLLPKDSEYVVTLNVRALLDSALTKKYGLPKMQELLKSDQEIQEIFKSLGLDSLSDIHSLTVASMNTKDPAKALFILHGKFDPAKIHNKALEVIQTYGEVLKVHKADPTRFYEVNFPGQTSFFVAVIDPSTIVASPGKDGLLEALVKAAGKKKSEVKKELLDLVAKVDSSRTLWMIGLKSALEHSPLNADDNARPVLAKIETAAAGVTVSTDIKAEFTLNAKSADAAKELSKDVVEKLNNAKGIVSILVGDVKELQILLELVDALKVSTQDRTVTLRGQIGEETIEKSLKK